MITDLLQAPRTAGGEISDLLQRTLERRPDSTCLVCGSGGGDLSAWRVPTQMKSELKQRNRETEMSNRSAHFKCHFAKNSIKILCQPNSAQIN